MTNHLQERETERKITPAEARKADRFGAGAVVLEERGYLSTVAIRRERAGTIVTVTVYSLRTNRVTLSHLKVDRIWYACQSANKRKPSRSYDYLS